MKEIINYGEARRQQILKGFTNIEECIEEAPIEKARHGVYADNAQNRRLQRVGQEYGHAAQEKPEAGQEEGGAPEANVSLQNHARQASEEALVKVANDPSADAEMRKVATAELERRGVNVRAKNKKGDQSLRDGLADGDAKSASTFESMGFRQMDDEDLAQYAGVEDAAHAFIKQVGGDEDGFDLVVTKTSEGYRVDKYPYADVDNFESVTVKKIEDVAGAASKFGDPDAKDDGKKGGDIKSFSKDFIQAWDDYISEESEDGFNKMKSKLKKMAKKHGEDALISNLADAIRSVDSEQSAQSMLDDDEIAEEIENMLDEAKFKLSKKGKAALEKLRADADGDGKVSGAEGLVQSFNDMAEGDADFDAKGFKSFVKEKGGKAVKELAEAMRNMPSEAAVSDPDDSEIADEIESMFEEAGMRVPREAKKELDNLRGSGESVVAKWDAYMSDETGDGDDFETAINNLIDNKGQVKAIKDIAAAMKAVDSADANQSDLDDDEIADEIENMFEEAGIDLSKKGQAALDKMREEANADADVDDAGKYVDSFNDMAENDTDFDAKGFKSFVKEKGDARAIKALARYMRENPVDTGGVESEPGDGDLADEIENMFEMAGVKISKKGRKELDAMIASEDDE
jgi:hypothetical protein